MVIRWTPAPVLWACALSPKSTSQISGRRKPVRSQTYGHKDRSRRSLEPFQSRTVRPVRQSSRSWGPGLGTRPHNWWSSGLPLLQRRLPPPPLRRQRMLVQPSVPKLTGACEATWTRSSACSRSNTLQPLRKSTLSTSWRGGQNSTTTTGRPLATPARTTLTSFSSI